MIGKIGMEIFKNKFPKSNDSNIKITSPITDNYNCISWACGSNSIRIWPNLRYFQWPEEIPNTEHIDSFVKLFELIGYKICKNGILENGYEKICLYEKDGVPQHAARQLHSGLWTSKLGPSYDIEHEERALCGGDYGDISIHMKRKIKL
jgi:hypothetical protein